MLLIKIFFIKKHVTLLFRNDFATWIYFCVYLVFHWNDIVEKILPKVGLRKRGKKRRWSYRGLYIEAGSKPWFFQPSCRCFQVDFSKYETEAVIEIMVGHRSWPTRFPIWPNNLFLKFVETTDHWMRLYELWSATNCICLTW